LVVTLLSSTARSEPGQLQHDVIPARDDTDPPAGYHRETRVRQGLIIGGTITSAAGGLMLIAGIDQRQREQARSPEQKVDPQSGGVILILFGGLSLAVGVPLLTYGLLSPREVYARDRVSAVSLRLVASPAMTGPELAVAF
jgi:hypothetical protein